MHVKVLAIGDLQTNGEREVFFELNGQLRSLFVRDKNNEKSLTAHPKADKNAKGSIGAPMPGNVIDIKVKVGDKVEKGDPIIVLSAMKMETVVKAPISGKIKNIAVVNGQKLDGDDLLIDIE